MATSGRGLPQVPERLLTALWRRRASRAGLLTAQDGRRLRVLYPGRLSSTAGPDLRDVVIEDESGRVTRGDAEVHVRQSDWHAHGHDADPRYARVTLHLVLVPEAIPTVQTQAPPTVLALGPLLYRRPVEAEPPSPWTRLSGLGYVRPDSLDELKALLDAAGGQRFMGRSAWFDQRLESGEPSQVLYEGLMEALGYSQNRDQFLELARLAPYAGLRELALESTPRLREQTVLGGLSRRGASISWHTFRVRPANHPMRRMAGAAILVCRYAREGLVEGLARIVRQGDPRLLTDGLAVTRDGSALVGRGRAGDMAVNVVLPFFHALGSDGGDATLSETALTLYRSYPRLQSNELTREMASITAVPGWEQAASTARRQQGLIHLYRLLTGTGPSHESAADAPKVGVVR